MVPLTFLLVLHRNINLQGGPRKFLDAHNLVTSECNVVLFYDTHKKSVPFWPELVTDGRMLGEGDSFHGIAEAHSQRVDIHAVFYYDYCQGKSFQQSF